MSDDSDSLADIEQIPNSEISKYEAVIEEYPDYYENVSIKEETPFMETDYINYDAASLENFINYDNELLPEEPTYHYNNKIILGSCLSSSENVGLMSIVKQRDAEVEREETLIAKENLNAVVLLENWGANLEKSRSFCKDCGTLFATQNVLDAHKMFAHSFLVPVNRNVAIKSTSKPAFIRKSTVKSIENMAKKSTSSKMLGSKFCNHCSLVFPDHDSLIKHLYELLTLKQFMCKICNLELKSKKELDSHNIVHVKNEKPEVKKENSKQNMVKKKKLVPKEDVTKKRPDSPKKTMEAIPISILYQCPTCGVYVTSSHAGLMHLKYCNTGMRGRTTYCRICNRKFSYKNIKYHKKQHKLCSKFKVYKLTKNISDKILCKCLNCELHFSEISMILHLKSCGKIVSAHCQTCNILLPKSKIDYHMTVHTQLNVKPKDFIIVPHVVQKNPLKRKLDPPKTTAKKIKLDLTNIKIEKTLNSVKEIKIKKEPELNLSKKEKEKIVLPTKQKFEKKGKVRVYFCSNCKSCSRKLNTDYHVEKHCISSGYEKQTVICSDCGLQFNRKTILSHKIIHTKKKLTIHDMVFYHMSTLKRTIPSMPKYPQCSNCKINFFDVNVKLNHICGEDYESCKVCGEKFHNSAYNVHIEFHNLMKIDHLKPKMETKLFPELIKKYHSLNMMWNIIYLCKKCEVVTDQYDKAVEHSQGHLNNEPMTKNIKCYICNLKIDETCWSKHSELHSQMTINSNNFKILSYNPQHLLSEEWFQLFETLPEDQIRQITDKSLYGYERRYKIMLLKEGRSEFTLYCCSNCKVCCRNNEINKHKNGACKSSENVCKICSVPFCDISTLRNHQILHLRGIKKEEFRVVMFTKSNNNENKDRKIRLRKTKKKDMKVTSASLYCESNKSGKYFLYKCKQCNGCVHRKCHVSRHNCDSKSKGVYECKQCKETFITNKASNYEEVHKVLHETWPDFNIKNTKIVLFNPCNNKYFCNASLASKKHSTSNKSEERNLTNTIKSKPAKGSSKTTKKQNKIVPTNNANSIVSTVATTVTKPATVYKCACGLHYTSLTGIEKHIPNCPDSNVSKDSCSKCGLLFPTNILVSHLCKHHSHNSKFVVENYQKDAQTSFGSVESTSESPLRDRKTTISPFNCEVKLYKCSECNVHFIAQNTCYKHVYKNHTPLEPFQYIECKLCGLQFTVGVLSGHVMKHHMKELDLAKVLVEEYQPRLYKGPLKINLYVAADKVQSLQVTSSMEESKLYENEKVVE